MRIECEHSDYQIESWIITDENGNKFYFRQKEWSVDIVKEDAISFNGIRGKSYISSWYISRIEPRNYDPIVYNYKANVNPYLSSEQPDINMVSYYIAYLSKYYYGAAMRNRPFNFSKYEKEFNESIATAKAFLDFFLFELELNCYMFEFNEFGQSVLNPDYESSRQNYMHHYRIIGQLANFSKLGNASSGAISTLNQLIKTYSSQTSLAAKMAASYFGFAKGIMIQCIKEVEFISTQQTSSYSSINIKSPMLDNIICNNKVVKFDYGSKSDDGCRMTAIKIEDIANNAILHLQFIGNPLQRICFIGSNGVEFGQIKFAYYGLDGTNYINDLWGFKRKNEPDYTDYQYTWPVDKEGSKYRSLSKITTMDKGEIIIDYEPNVIPSREMPESLRDFGGLRIKSLVLKEPVTNTVDSIEYIYPYPGELVYSDSYNLETIDYGGFVDKIRHTRAKNIGNAFLNTGNNGVYYDYIEEEFVGKGKKTYLFYNPSRMLLPTNLPYKFWLNGLPLGSAIYDNNGNLKSITKNSYWADIELDDKINEKNIENRVRPYLNIYEKGNWFTESNNTAKYIYAKHQIKAYEYYMDHQRIESYYKDQSNVLLYNDNGDHFINPYQEVFVQNIAPRTSPVLPEQRWDLVYGGKILIKSQEEYRVEGNYSTASSINHGSR